MSYLFSTSYFHFCFLGEDKDEQFSVFLDWSNDGVWVLIAPHRPGSKFWVCSWCSYFFLKNFTYLFIYLFLAVLGLHFCARAFSSCGKRGPLFIAVRRPLTIVASLVAEHRLQTHRLSNCGSWA